MANEAADTEPAESLLTQFKAIAAANGGLDEGGDDEPTAADATPEKKNDAPDWAAFRAQQREAKQRIDALESAIAAREQAIAAREKAAEATSPERIRSHLESGKFDDIALALGFQSWNDLNDQAARAFASPGFKRIRELEERVAAREAERAEERRQYEEQYAEAQRQQNEREFIAFVDSSLKTSENETVRALAEADDGFTRAVYGTIAAHYRQTGQELTPTEAAAGIVDGLRAKMTKWLKVKSLGAQQAATAQAVTPDRAGSNKPARQTNKVARTAEPASESHAEWIAKAARELRQAMDEDIRGMGG